MLSAEKQIGAAGTAIAQADRKRADHEAPENPGYRHRHRRRGGNHDQRTIADRDARNDSERDEARPRQPRGSTPALYSLKTLTLFPTDHRNLQGDIDESNNSRNHSASIKALSEPLLPSANALKNQHSLKFSDDFSDRGRNLRADRDFAISTPKLCQK